MAEKNSLETYRNKRDFRRTPEPPGDKGAKQQKKRIFVIQKHDASRLHYDFRIEIGGVLKSWAVPKGPSVDPAEKRLAVQTEDHPMDYADFEGVIPPDEYGGATVIVWDAGAYRNLRTDTSGKEIPMDDCAEDGRIEIWLEGKKLRGGYALVRTRMGGRRRQKSDKNNWLLIKMKDEAVDRRRKPTSSQPESVISGKTVEQLTEEQKKEES
ncbi:MAG: DNA polymerase ligase N-terminal domain-containing protein [Planctomycetota bacterium]